MPLAERDVNTQHQRPLARGKRLPAAGYVTDENATPSPVVARTKETPTSPQRFFTPTKASTAKNTPPSATNQPRVHPHLNRDTPRSRTQGSKLPRRNAAKPTAKPAYNPPISKWNLSVANATGPEKTMNTLQTSPSSPTPIEVTVNQSLIAHEDLPFVTQRASAEKPLPSRPIASLAYAPSPSRDSRGLIDASERPLRMFVAGTERDWPTLIPSSQSTPVLVATTSHTATAASSECSKRLSASANSLVSAAPEPTAPDATLGFDSATQSAEPSGLELARSSVASYVTTPQVSYSSESPDSTLQDTQHHTPNVDVVETPILVRPPRKDSLPSPHINHAPIERSQSTGPNMSGSPEFARDIFEASRPHSPSPASFSRPRPTSFSQITSMISMPKTAMGITPVKSQKTASRIPLPDQKKATLVDIRGRRTSGIPMPKFEKGLSFGGRRIDSPDPLKVLDHGIRRRQLKRSNTGGSSSTTSTVPTRFLSNSTPTVDRSKANTPDSTMGSSSEEEEEVTTPSDKPMHFVKHGYKPKHVSRASGSNYAGATLKVYDEAEVILGRPPPSNSPFTGPLPTIPSQSALPVLAASARNSVRTDPRTKVVMKPTEFSAFAQRISVLQDSRDFLIGDRRDCQSLVGSDTKSELVNILREAENEDAMITQCGAEGLDVEMKEQITSTLGMLEGRCGPTNTTVNLEHLSRMFGRLKSGFEKAPKSAAFIEDATVAEQFLARRESTAGKTSDMGVHRDGAGVEEASPAPSNDDDATSQISRSKTVASKWSTSTPSAREQPLAFAETGPHQGTFGIDFEDMPPALPPKHVADNNPTSIGYPSREPGKAHRLLGTEDQAAGARKTTTRRESSPTLGIRIPGSVRVAREKARDAAGSRANQTSTTKFEKLPTSNTKVFRVSHDPPRGRLQSAEKTSHHDFTKPPRSRSKSRFMLDKLNGLFSGRREKRNSQLPPIPPAKDNHEYEKSISSPKEIQIGSSGSPLPKDGRIPPLTKMPTMTPPVDAVHPALRSGPSSTSIAPSTMTIGSDADMEGRRSLQALSDKLLGRALKEGDPAKKERLLNFAKVLNDSLISAREAQISAETAQTAARSAQMSYEMTMKSVAMLQRLASSMNRR